MKYEHGIFVEARQRQHAAQQMVDQEIELLTSIRSEVQTHFRTLAREFDFALRFDAPITGLEHKKLQENGPKWQGRGAGLLKVNMDEDTVTLTDGGGVLHRILSERAVSHTFIENKVTLSLEAGCEHLEPALSRCNEVPLWRGAHSDLWTRRRPGAKSRT